MQFGERLGYYFQERLRDPVAMRQALWLGRRFWLYVLLWLVLVPFLQFVVLCTLAVPNVLSWSLAVINFAIAGVLFLLAWGFTWYASHALTVPAVLMGVLKTTFPRDYEKFEFARQRCSQRIAASQKESFVSELVNQPFAFTIFGRYIWRVVFVVLAIPIYLSAALLFGDMIPVQHRGGDSPSGMKVLRALAVVRDIQMGTLGGTSTEHMPEWSDAGDDATPKGVGTRNRLPSPPPYGRLAGWEVIGLICTSVYVCLALVLLPLQLGVVSNLDRHFKSPDFWKRLLGTGSPTPKGRRAVAIKVRRAS